MIKYFGSKERVFRLWEKSIWDPDQNNSELWEKIFWIMSKGYFGLWENAFWIVQKSILDCAKTYFRSCKKVFWSWEKVFGLCKKVFWVVRKGIWIVQKSVWDHEKRYFVRRTNFDFANWSLECTWCLLTPPSFLQPELICFLQYPAMPCNTLQCSAMPCNTLQYPCSSNTS